MQSFAHNPTSDKYSQASPNDKFLPEAIRSKSNTRIPLNLTGCWNAKLIPFLARSEILMSVISCPSIKIEPDAGLSIPAISFANVDLPPPFGPVTTTNFPSSTVRLILLKIFFVPFSSFTSKDNRSNFSIFIFS